MSLDATLQDARERVLQTAGPIFAEKGFRDTTVREICDRAQVNLASVNYYFRDKEGLYLEVVRRAHQGLLEQVPTPLWAPETPAEQKLTDFIRALLTRMLGDAGAPWQHSLMLRELLYPTHACRALVEDYIRPQFEVLQAILSELLPESTATAVRQQIVFSIVGQCLYYRVAPHVVRMLVGDADLANHFGVEPLVHHISQFTLAALGASGQGLPAGVPISAPKSRTRRHSSPN